MNRYIEVTMPENMEDVVLYYEKVAERDNFKEEDAKELLQQNVTYNHSINVGNEDCVKLVDLEDGIYQIYISGDEEYEFMPMLVSMPAWNEEKEQILYEVTVTPKYTKTITHTEVPVFDSPKTGDFSNSTIFGAFGMISFIIVVIMSCHKRFKCARMSE